LNRCALVLVLALAAPALADQPTADEVSTWAKKVDETIRAHDASFLDQSFDFALIVSRAFTGLGLKDSVKEDFVTGLKKGKGYGTAIVAGLGKKGSWKLVRVTKKEEKDVAIFRIVPENGAFAYHEFVLDKNDGKICVTDTFAFGSGIKLASQVRADALALALKEDPTILDRLDQHEAERTKHWKELQGIWQMQVDKKWLDAIEAYKKLPQTLQETRMVLLMKLTAARHVSEDEKAAVIEALEKKHSDDPTAGFRLLEAGYEDRDWKMAEKGLDILDKATGGDAYLDFKRCEVHFTANEYDAARAAGNKALDKEPDLAAAHWALIGLANKQKDWEGVVNGLDRAEKNGIKIPDLTRSPNYGEFVKSDDYREWKKAHEEKK